MSTVSPAPKRPVPTVEQARVLTQIALQRDRLRARRLARSQQSAHDAAAAPGGESSVPMRLAVFARQHPVAVAVAVGVALMAGPKRVIRWVGIALPLIMQLRR